MGRAKLNMELITKEKSRNTTFKKRKEGLIRKMHEFTTLCDVTACIIIYGPRSASSSSSAAEPEIWPPAADEVRRIIDIYKAKNKDSGNKTFGISDFFHDRARKIDDELAKLRKKNMEAKFPTWHDSIAAMSEPQLRSLAAYLAGRAEYVAARLEFLRTTREGLCLGLDMSNFADFGQQRLAAPPPQPRLNVYELEVFKQQAAYSAAGMEQQQNPMMALLLNDGDFAGGSGVAGGGNIQCATTSYKRHQVFYEAAAGGVVDHHVMCHSPNPLQARYYGTTVLSPAPPPYGAVPLPLPLPLPPPPMQFSGAVESYEEGQLQHNVAGPSGQFQMVGRNDRLRPPQLPGI
ncbi:agamous-like MADS-box protein AGL11 [Andrographis paniculata]|uniref:agamous-like MADS-box protein AGL11 n=1 Tax=Andrographis paniculata TaxID=175694 RepID=UPI0021E903A2|nr:agamous-like MADS-box protein AGL11 [Andrographis paniculata]